MVCIFDDDDDGTRDDDDGSLKRKRTGGCLRARHCCGFCSSFYPPCTAYMLVVVEVSMSCVVLMQRVAGLVSVRVVVFMCGSCCNRVSCARPFARQVRTYSLGQARLAWLCSDFRASVNRWMALALISTCLALTNGPGLECRDVCGVVLTSRSVIQALVTVPGTCPRARGGHDVLGSPYARVKGPRHVDRPR